MTGGHGEMATLAAGYVIGALDPEEERAFSAHLSLCAECAAEVASLSGVLPALAEAVPQAAPSLDLKTRVLAAATSVADVPASSKVVSIGATRPSPARASGMRLWLPLAAMLALTVGLGVYTLGLRQRITVLEARLEEANSRVLLADRAVNDARRVAFETQSATSILLSPDVVRIDLSGQAGSGAMARANWSRQRGMVFTATNLPPLRAGRTYQVWVVTANANAPLSAGLMMPDADGRVMTVFNTAPDIPQPVAVAVTDEPAGGMPAPTTMPFLVGSPRPS